jgi:hypothetical protein
MGKIMDLLGVHEMINWCVVWYTSLYLRRNDMRTRTGIPTKHRQFSVHPGGDLTHPSLR